MFMGLWDFKPFMKNAPEKTSSLSSGNYAYVSARVKAKRSLLLSNDIYPRLLMMDVVEITRFIGESQYRKEVNELGLQYTGLELTEIALNRNYANVSRQILGFCKGDLRAMVEAYLHRWDVWNIKAVLRGKSYGAEPDAILKTLVSAGKYPDKYWSELVQNSKTIDDAIERLRGNEYHIVLMRLKKLHGSDLQRLENGLELEYYRMLLESIEPSSKPNKLFFEFIQGEIDLVNLQTLFMAKYDELNPMLIIELLIPGGSISKKKLSSLANASDFNKFLEALEVFPVYADIRDEVQRIDKTGTLNSVIRALEKGYIAKADKFSRLYPLSILPILNYLIRKQIEVDNLRIIARGRESGLSSELIRELLVV